MGLGTFIGKALKGARAGTASLLSRQAVSEAAPSLVVTSLAFANGQQLPARFSRKGGDLFPPLAWTGVPVEATEIVVVVEDADAPLKGHPFTHCILYGIDPPTTALDEGSVVDQTRQATPQTRAPVQLGRNSFGKYAWMGPDPIPGHGPHHYHFQVFALGTPLGTEGKITHARLKQALPGKVIAWGEVVGTFEKP